MGAGADAATRTDLEASLRTGVLPADATRNGARRALLERRRAECRRARWVDPLMGAFIAVTGAVVVATGDLAGLLYVIGGALLVVLVVGDAQRALHRYARIEAALDARATVKGR